MTELEALCHSTIDEDAKLRRWASLDAKEKVNVSTLEKDNGKELEEDKIIESLDASVDAILEML